MWSPRIDEWILYKAKQYVVIRMEFLLLYSFVMDTLIWCPAPPNHRRYGRPSWIACGGASLSIINFSFIVLKISLNSHNETTKALRWFYFIDNAFCFCTYLWLLSVVPNLKIQIKSVFCLPYDWSLMRIFVRWKSFI